jgi:hypothetical protein
MPTTAIEPLDVANSRAFEIRRWALNVRAQVSTLDDPDRLAELAALLEGAKHRLRQLREEVVEAERTRVQVMLRLGQVLTPVETTSPTRLTEQEAGLPKDIRYKARLMAANPAIVDAYSQRQRVSVNAIIKEIQRHRVAESQAEMARTARDRAAELNVHDGQVWALGDHRLYCGSSADKTFREMVAVAEPVFAFADVPTGIADTLDWLGGLAPVVALMPGVGDLGALLAGTTMVYRWMMVFGTHEATESPLGTGHYLPVCLFSQGGSLAHDASDYSRVTVELNHHRDARKPMSVLVKLFDVFTSSGDVVVDPFAGPHGLSLIAADRGKRRCITADPDPVNCASVISRYGGEARPL